MAYVVFSCLSPHYGTYNIYMNQNIRHAVDTIWSYLRIGTNPGPAECMIVLGSRDDRVASYAAGLAHTYNYDAIVISGGIAHQNDLLVTEWSETTEAEHFYEVMRTSGLTHKVLLEVQATDTGGNAYLSYTLLKAQGILPLSILVVTKPYMERRALATFEKQWPEHGVSIQVSSPPSTFDTYCNDAQPIGDVINIMVGDLERIIYYPELGYQTKQDVSSEVLQALSVLKSAGYTKRLLA